MDVSEIRKRLQIAPRPGIAWFSVNETHLAFAPHKAPGHRAVVLRTWPANSPLAIVFARSTTSRTGINHGPHEHKQEFPRCWLNRNARIVVEWPLSARKSLLDRKTAMCEEPDADITRRVLQVPVKP